MDTNNITAFINTEELFNILSGIIENDYRPTDDEKILLKRFIDKIADSENFALKVNTIFHKYKSLQNSPIKDKIQAREDVNIGCDFELRPRTDNRVNWYLTHKGEILLDELDTKLARKIASDINVAIKIIAAKTNKKQENTDVFRIEDDRYHSY